MTQPTPLDLLESGCSVMPVNANKRPALPSWKHLQETRPTAGDLEQWSSHLRPAAYAFVTGAISGRVTFDFDGAKGVELATAWGIKAHRRTGSGGLHLDVIHPGWSVPTLNCRSDGGLGERWPGLDIRGDGGYIIAIGRNESGPYEWLREPTPDPIEVIPVDVWEYLHSHSPEGRLNEPVQSPKPALARSANGSAVNASRVDTEKIIQRALDQAASEGRNNAGFWLATQLRDNGYSESEARGQICDYVARVPGVNIKGQPERYTDHEALASVREAYSRAAREPWERERRDVRAPRASWTPGEQTTEGPEEEPATGVPKLLSFHFNDSGNAERIIALYGTRLNYCHPFKKWLVWDGRRWAIDEAAQARKLAKQAMLEFLRQAVVDKNEAAEKFARSSLDARRITNMLSMAEPEIYIKPNELDENPYLLNCANGTVDLRTGELAPHNREDLITKLIPYEYRPEARCDRFLSALARLMGNAPDAEEAELQRAERLVSHLQKAFGYSATGITSEKAVFIPYGSGNNGKTTILTTISRVLGDYSGVILIDSIMSRQENNNASADLADLRSTRFVVTSETEEGQRLAEGKLKRITQGVAGGKIKACRKYENPVEFLETHKLWMDCNHKPVIRGTEAAIWNRIHLIPFTVTIKVEEIDWGLPAKLMGEAEGILAWVVAGAVRWQGEGLGKPPDVVEAVREYREEMDQVGRFVEELCITGEFVNARGRELYTAYRKWAEDAGEYFVTETAFALKLKERGFQKSHTNAGAKYQGIGIRT